MATVHCAACPRRSHLCRTIPDITGMGREWLLRLNLIEDEFKSLEEKVALIQAEGRRAWLCPYHFKDKNHRDAYPEDHRETRVVPQGLPKKGDVQAEVVEPRPAPTVDDMVDAMSDLLFPSPQRTQSGETGVSGDNTANIIHIISVHSQDTINTEETSDTGVQCDPPTPPSHDYFLVKKDCLLSLFTRCHECGKKEIEEGTFKCHTVGSALVLEWKCLVCEREVEYHSQPMVERYFEGNLKLTSAVHTTSVSRPRFLDMGKLIGLALPSERTMRRQLKRIVVPAVDKVFIRHMKQAEATVRTSNIAGIDIAVDGRYSHVGRTAPNCTVPFVDIESNLIIHVKNMHKDMPGIDGVSGRMEKEGVRMGLRELQAKQLVITSLVSDNDAKISKMMRELFPGIHHHLDFWHIVKNLNKALRELTKRKDCPHIEHWRRELIDHCYFVHGKFEKDRKKGVEYMKSSLAHVTGWHKHFEKVPFLKGISECLHNALPDASDHEIDPKSTEFAHLKEVILKPSFIVALERASPKKNTSPCEWFNSLLNIYAPKRIASYCVKRKMESVDQYWRREEVEGVVREMKEASFLKRKGIPDSNRYMAALYADEEESEGDSKGEENDVSIEYGAAYGEDVDSDTNPIAPSEDDSEHEEGNDTGESRVEEVPVGEKGAEGVEASSGPDWDQGEEEKKVAAVGSGQGRGRGRGRGRGKGRGASSGKGREEADREAEGEDEDEPSTKQGRKRKAKRGQEDGEDGEDEGSDGVSTYEPPKRGRGRGKKQA